MSRRVLITGGCGFAGSHLVAHLLATTDWQLTILDSLTYAGRADRLADMVPTEHRDRVRIVWHELQAPISGTLARKLGSPNVIYHLAANTHVDRSIIDPVPFATANIIGTLNLLDYATDLPALTHFIQISTDEVYGPARGDHSHAEWEPHRPSNPYAASKAACEDLGCAWWRTYGLPYVVSNCMNLIGERCDPEKFLPLTISKILNDQPVPIHATPGGTPASRCWLHAADHADALRWIVEETDPTAYAAGATDPDRWHVVGEERTVLDLAKTVADILGRRLHWTYIDSHTARPGHDLRYALDGSKLAAAGWKLPYDLDTSLERTVRWYADNTMLWLTAG